jgi:type III secretion system YscQ/HrcQ family protein
MRSVKPYRTDLWPRWSRRGAALSSAIARQLFSRAPVTRAPLGDRLAALFGGASFEPRFLSVQPRETLAKTYAARPSVFAIMAMDSGPVAVAVDAPFARWIAAKCGGLSDDEALRWLVPTPWSAAMEGSFALACILAARALCEPGAPPVFRAATDRWDDVDRALAKGECALWPVAVRVGDFSGSAALIMPASAVRAVRERDPLWAARVEALDVSASLVCARSLVAREELEGLSAGSVIVLGAPLFKTDAGSIAGPMTLSLGPVECPVSFDATSVRCEGEPRARRSLAMATSDDENKPMNSTGATDPGARTALLATVPVEVEIVIARGIFAVGEVAAWRPGEVIALPTRVGEPVEIRAGGRLVARAELCDVDGEVGVRVLELLG